MVSSGGSGSVTQKRPYEPVTSTEDSNSALSPPPKRQRSVDVKARASVGSESGAFKPWKPDEPTRSDPFSKERLSAVTMQAHGSRGGGQATGSQEIPLALGSPVGGLVQRWAIAPNSPIGGVVELARVVNPHTTPRQTTSGKFFEQTIDVVHQLRMTHAGAGGLSKRHIAESMASTVLEFAKNKLQEAARTEGPWFARNDQIKNAEETIARALHENYGFEVPPEYWFHPYQEHIVRVPANEENKKNLDEFFLEKLSELETSLNLLNPQRTN